MNEKLPKATLDKLCRESNKRYFVQSGYGRGPYTTRYTSDNYFPAEIHYRALLVHSGYKKRIVDTVEGVITDRYIS